MANAMLGFVLIVLAMAGLGLGVLAGRAPLKGSCGGHGCSACATCPRRAAREQDGSHD